MLDGRLEALAEKGDLVDKFWLSELKKIRNRIGCDGGLVSINQIFLISGWVREIEQMAKKLNDLKASETE